MRNNSSTSNEFRIFLSTVQPDDLKSYTAQCLEKSFPDSGFVLQDVVNEIGRRLGFGVEFGNYQGTSTNPAPDGLWKVASGQHFVVEVKTTDAYAINLDRIEFFRQHIIRSNQIVPERCSTVLIVGRQDTGGLEAQIRGSRYAWSTRLLSVDGLLKLLDLRSSIDSDEDLAKIYEVLIPREYTKVDNIIDLVFSINQTVEAENVADTGMSDRLTMVSSETVIQSDTLLRAGKEVQELCLLRIAKRLGETMMREASTKFKSANGHTRLVLPVSRPYTKATGEGFWFAFHSSWSIEYLDSAETAYVAFGCGFKGDCILIDWPTFKKWLPMLNTSTQPGRQKYNHVSIDFRGGQYFLNPKATFQQENLTKYALT